jgi:hypothetical protein
MEGCGALGGGITKQQVSLTTVHTDEDRHLAWIEKIALLQAQPLYISKLKVKKVKSSDEHLNCYTEILHTSTSSQNMLVCS